MTSDECTGLREEYAALKKQESQLEDRRRDIERELDEVILKMERIENRFADEGEELELEANGT